MVMAKGILPGRTPLSDHAAVLLRGTAGQVLPELVEPLEAVG